MLIQNPSPSQWQSITATLSSGGTIGVGNGTAAGFRRRVGDSYEYRFFFKFGASGSTFGSGPWSIVLDAAVDEAKIAGGFNENNCVGNGILVDTSAGIVYHVGVTVTGSTSIKFMINASGSVQPTLPFTWAATDTLSCNFKVPIVGLS